MKAQEVFLAILTDLARSIQAAALYPETHQRVQEPLARLHRTVRNEAKRLGGSLGLGFLGDRIVVDQFPFHASAPGIGRLAGKLASRGIEKVAIGEAVTLPEMKRFVYFVAGVGETGGSRPWNQLSFGRIQGNGPAEFAASGGAEVLTAPQALAGATDVLKDVLVRRRLEAEASMPPPDPQTVNLIGFPKSWGTVELCEILGQAGVRVNEILIPSLDPEKVVRLPQAALNVIWPNALWQHLYDQLHAESRTPAITPPAPFGLDGTLRWLQTVGEAVGRGPAMRQAAHERADALVERFDALRSKASQERLCFVVRSSQHELLTEPARSWGVPLLETVESMGFAVDVFIHVRGRAGAKETAQAIHRLFLHPERHVIRAFETYGQMQSRLSDSPARAVFTQHTFDWRVTSAHKAPFSLQHFEHGLMGAVLTLERLLGVCRVEFYHRLGRYLGRTPDGRRSPPWETLPRNPGDGREGLP